MPLPLDLREPPMTGVAQAAMASGSAQTIDLGWVARDWADVTVYREGAVQPDDGSTWTRRGDITDLSSTPGVRVLSSAAVQGEVWTVVRGTPLSRLTTFSQAGDRDGERFEAEFNNLWLMAQEIAQAQRTRVLQLPVHVVAPPPEQVVTGFPPGVANNFLRWDDDGQLENVPANTIARRPLSPWALAWLQLASAEGGRAALELLDAALRDVGGGGLGQEAQVPGGEFLGGASYRDVGIERGQIPAWRNYGSRAVNGPASQEQDFGTTDGSIPDYVDPGTVPIPPGAEPPPPPPGVPEPPPGLTYNPQLSQGWYELRSTTDYMHQYDRAAPGTFARFDVVHTGDAPSNGGAVVGEAFNLGLKAYNQYQGAILTEQPLPDYVVRFNDVLVFPDPPTRATFLRGRVDQDPRDLVPSSGGYEPGGTDVSRAGPDISDLTYWYRTRLQKTEWEPGRAAYTEIRIRLASWLPGQSSIQQLGELVLQPFQFLQGGGSRKVWEQLDPATTPNLSRNNSSATISNNPIGGMTADRPALMIRDEQYPPGDQHEDVYFFVDFYASIFGADPTYRVPIRTDASTTGFNVQGWLYREGRLYLRYITQPGNVTRWGVMAGDYWYTDTPRLQYERPRELANEDDPDPRRNPRNWEHVGADRRGWWHLSSGNPARVYWYEPFGSTPIGVRDVIGPATDASEFLRLMW